MQDSDYKAKFMDDLSKKILPGIDPQILQGVSTRQRNAMKSIVPELPKFTPELKEKIIDATIKKIRKFFPDMQILQFMEALNPMNFPVPDSPDRINDFVRDISSLATELKHDYPYLCASQFADFLRLLNRDKVLLRQCKAKLRYLQ